MREDPNFVRIAVMQNGEALKFASSDLQKDEELIKLSNAMTKIRQNANAI